jgi:hypothetical protein
MGVGFVAGGYAYFRLPDGPAYAADPEFWSLPSAQLLIAFLLPTTAAAIYALIRAVWARDPIRDRDERFEPTYDAIVFAVMTFIIAIHFMVVVTVTGAISPARDWLTRATIVLFGLLIVRVGNLLPRTRPNLALGFRTSRTLTDRQLWMHVHRACGYVAVVFGLVLVASGAFFPKHLIQAAVGSASLVAMIVLVVSFFRPSLLAPRT